jgi:hypothetical protein
MKDDERVDHLACVGREWTHRFCGKTGWKQGCQRLIHVKIILKLILEKQDVRVRTGSSASE